MEEQMQLSATTVPTYCRSPVGQPDHARNPTLCLRGLPEDMPVVSGLTGTASIVTDYRRRE
jgi:hypothetical protein